MNFSFAGITLNRFRCASVRSLLALRRRLFIRNSQQCSRIEPGPIERTSHGSPARAVYHFLVLSFYIATKLSSSLAIAARNRVKQHSITTRGDTAQHGKHTYFFCAPSAASNYLLVGFNKRGKNPRAKKIVAVRATVISAHLVKRFHRVTCPRRSPRMLRSRILQRDEIRIIKRVI